MQPWHEADFYQLISIFIGLFIGFSIAYYRNLLFFWAHADSPKPKREQCIIIKLGVVLQFCTNFSLKQVYLH